MKQQVIIYHTDGEIVKLPQNYFNYYILWYNVKMTSPENTEGTERVVVETIDAMEDPPEDPTRSQRIADGVMAQIGEIEDDPGLFGGQRLDPDVHRVLDADSNRAFTKALREKERLRVLARDRELLPTMNWQD